MADPMKVILRITSVKGTCAAGHKVGDELNLSKDFTLGYSGNGRTLCSEDIHNPEKRDRGKHEIDQDQRSPWRCAAGPL